MSSICAGCGMAQWDASGMVQSFSVMLPWEIFAYIHKLYQLWNICLPIHMNCVLSSQLRNKHWIPTEASIFQQQITSDDTHFCKIIQSYCQRKKKFCNIRVQREPTSKLKNNKHFITGHLDKREVPLTINLFLFLLQQTAHNISQTACPWLLSTRGSLGSWCAGFASLLPRSCWAVRLGMSREDSLSPSPAISFPSPLLALAALTAQLSYVQQQSELVWKKLRPPLKQGA